MLESPMRAIQKYRFPAMTGMAQWAGYCPEDWKVASLIPACAWVVGQVPGWGHASGNWSMFLSHIDVSLPRFSLSFSLSLKINK